MTNFEIYAIIKGGKIEIEGGLKAMRRETRKVMEVIRESGLREYYFFPPESEDKIEEIGTWDELMKLAYHRSDRLPIAGDYEVVRTVTERELRLWQAIRRKMKEVAEMAKEDRPLSEIRKKVDELADLVKELERLEREAGR